MGRVSAVSARRKNGILSLVFQQNKWLRFRRKIPADGKETASVTRNDRKANLEMLRREENLPRFRVKTAQICTRQKRKNSCTFSLYTLNLKPYFIAELIRFFKKLPPSRETNIDTKRAWPNRNCSRRKKNRWFFFSRQYGNPPLHQDATRYVHFPLCQLQ